MRDRETESPEKIPTERPKSANLQVNLLPEGHFAICLLVDRILQLAVSKTTSLSLYNMSRQISYTSVRSLEQTYRNT